MHPDEPRGAVDADARPASAGQRYAVPHGHTADATALAQSWIARLIAGGNLPRRVSVGYDTSGRLWAVADTDTGRRKKLLGRATVRCVDLDSLAYRATDPAALEGDAMLEALGV